MRILIMIPIVHSSADMGSMKEALAKEAMAKLGEKGWEEQQLKIENFWNEVEKSIDKLRLNPKNIRIYQDGLPYTKENMVMKIISQAAEKGSRNYKIVKNLAEHGARIEPTESPELLLEEYNFIKAFAEAEGKEREDAKKRYEDAKEQLLEKRDEFIAERINSTLREGEIGILFIGAHHKVKPKLGFDIKVESL